MTAYFLDSSALVKRYIPEIGTSWIQSIADPKSGNSILIAQIAPVEIVSGVMRRSREYSVTVRTAYAIRLIVDRHTRRELRVVALTTQIIQSAENILQQHPLRAYDAVQLASAVEGNARLLTARLPPLVFVSADNRLLTAAKAVGLSTDNPDLHP